MTALEKIQEAIKWVGRTEPIVVPAALANWHLMEDPARKVMATNGRVLAYNPAWVEASPLRMVKMVVLHEVGHVISNHHHRRGNRDSELYNEACDLALNEMLRRGYLAAYDRNGALFLEEAIPMGSFIGHGKYEDWEPNLSAEEYYTLLKAKRDEEQKQQQPEQEDQDNDDEENAEEEGGNETTQGESGPGGDGGGDECPEDFGQSAPEEGYPDQEGGSEDSGGVPESPNGEDGEVPKGGGESDSENSAGAEPGADDDAKVPGSGSGTGGLGDSLNVPGQGAGDPEADNTGSANELGSEKRVGTGSGFGEIEDAPEGAELREDEANLIMAGLTSGGGYSPLGLGDMLTSFASHIQNDAAVAASVNWRRELEKFLRTTHAAGFKFNKPSRRHGWRTDVVLPARQSRNKTRGLCVVDTSGSMRDVDCNKALDHLGKILGMFPQSTVTMVHCDTDVRQSMALRSSDFPIKDWTGWAGRGGTDMAPALKWAQENRSQYDWMILVTDMEWEWWQAENPGVPTLWICTKVWTDHQGDAQFCGSNQHEIPFGKLVAMHPTRR